MKLCIASLAFLLVALAPAHSFAQPTPQPSSAPTMPGHPPSAGGGSLQFVAVSPSVLVAEPAAPPVWAQEVMVSAQKLPYLGPVIAKVLLYLGIATSILTMLVTFLLCSITALSGGATFLGLTGVANWLVAFRDGKFMYWLKFFSNFNAKKPDPL